MNGALLAVLGTLISTAAATSPTVTAVTGCPYSTSTATYFCPRTLATLTITGTALSPSPTVILQPNSLHCNATNASSSTSIICLTTFAGLAPSPVNFTITVTTSGGSSAPAPTVTVSPLTPLCGWGNVSGTLIATTLVTPTSNSCWLRQALSPTTAANGSALMATSYACNSTGNCFYSWYSASALCPPSWRLPALADAVNLSIALGNFPARQVVLSGSPCTGEGCDFQGTAALDVILAGYATYLYDELAPSNPPTAQWWGAGALAAMWLSDLEFPGNTVAYRTTVLPPRPLALQVASDYHLWATQARDYTDLLSVRCVGGAPSSPLSPALVAKQVAVELQLSPASVALI